MSEEKSTIAKDIEELVNKTIEANKFFISEGSQIFKQFTNQGANKESPNFVQPDAIANVFNAYLQLNLQHAKNLVDLGVSLVKQAVANPASADRGAASTATGNTAAETPAADAEPSFVLHAEALAGATVSLQFLLDNVRQERVVCRLVNSTYQLQERADIAIPVPTSFSPQAFELNPGAAQTVQIAINTDKKMLPGNYTSNVQVEGFEPAYFSIHLTINEKPVKPSVHGRKKAK